jgi:hypothetical protein
VKLFALLYLSPEDTYLLLTILQFSLLFLHLLFQVILSLWILIVHLGAEDYNIVYDILYSLSASVLNYSSSWMMRCRSRFYSFLPRSARYCSHTVIKCVICWSDIAMLVLCWWGIPPFTRCLRYQVLSCVVVIHLPFFGPMDSIWIIIYGNLDNPKAMLIYAMSVCWFSLLKYVFKHI